MFDILNLKFFLHILSILVNIRLHTENWLCNLPGSALEVPVGGWWWLERKLSDQLWLSFSLALAKANKNKPFVGSGSCDG